MALGLPPDSIIPRAWCGWDGTSTLYIADQNNNLIRALLPSTALVTTVAGSGYAASINGAGSAASFSYPTGLAFSGGILYVNKQTSSIRAVNVATAVVSTFAGGAGRQQSGYADGSGTAALFSYRLASSSTPLAATSWLATRLTTLFAASACREVP